MTPYRLCRASIGHSGMPTRSNKRRPLDQNNAASIVGEAAREAPVALPARNLEPHASASSSLLGRERRHDCAIVMVPRTTTKGAPRCGEPPSGTRGNALGAGLACGFGGLGLLGCPQERGAPHGPRSVTGRRRWRTRLLGPTRSVRRVNVLRGHTATRVIIVDES
jgi:hypothetical protein